MNVMRRHGQGSGSTRRHPVRLSAPVALVAGAVALIGIASTVSLSRMHVSLPGSINLPASGPAFAALVPPVAARPSSGPAAVSEIQSDHNATSVTGGPSADRNSPRSVSAPTMVSPSYPLGEPGQKSTSTTSTTGAPNGAPPSTAAGATTTVEPGDDSTESVSPDYPVITTQPGPTTTVTSTAVTPTTDS